MTSRTCDSFARGFAHLRPIIGVPFHKRTRLRDPFCAIGARVFRVWSDASGASFEKTPGTQGFVRLFRIHLF